jgi:protoporphyrinogen oxidase
MESLFGWAKRRKKSRKTVKTLIHEFHYPRLGPGQMWEAAAASVQKHGGEVIMDAAAFSLARANGKWEVKYRTGEGAVHTVTADHVINSMPMAALAPAIENPKLSAAALDAASGLRYRDFLVVGLMARDRGSFDDQWLYIHDPRLKVGRIQNFKSWSPDMVPDPAMNCYGLEYFCFEGDGIWDAADEKLVEMAKEEFIKLGLAKREDIQDGASARPTRSTTKITRPASRWCAASWRRNARICIPWAATACTATTTKTMR